MIRVTVAGMILDQQTGGPVLLLHVPPLDKYLPIWIGPHEAASIGMALKGERFERPLTHDLVCTIIDGLEGRVARAVIHDLRGNTFFAKVFIERGQQLIGIDARPSDSIAIAVRTSAPIFVAEAVVEREGGQLITLDEEALRRVLGGQEPTVEGAGPVGAEDDARRERTEDDEEEAEGGPQGG